MFEIDLCDARRIALIRLRGEVTEQDLIALDALADQQQATSGFDTVIDLIEVQKSTLTTDLISKRGSLPRAFKDRERIYVVQHPDLKLLIRLFVHYQEAKGWRPPVMVETLTEALERLQVTLADFRPAFRSTAR
jgi:hypothetical protein